MQSADLWTVVLADKKFPACIVWSREHLADDNCQALPATI